MVDRKLIAAVERLGRALRAARQSVATELGLSLLGLQILEVLGLGASRTVGELTAELDVRQPTISDALSTLESHGFVSREASPSDGRIKVVTLTTGGDELSRRITAAMAPILGGPRHPDPRRGTALEVLLEEILRLQRAGVITVNRSCLSCTHFRPAGDDGPAHCLLLDSDLPPAALRVDCDDHDPAEVSDAV